MTQYYSDVTLNKIPRMQIEQICKNWVIYDQMKSGLNYFSVFCELTNSNRFDKSLIEY